MKRAIVFLAVALALPTSVAFAKSPHTNQGTRGKSNPMVMYVLKGTLSSYNAATADQPGSISITVNHSNYHGRLLKNAGTLVFTTTMNTRLTFKHSTTSEIIDGNKGIVKFRGPLMRHASASDTPLAFATALTSTVKVSHIIDQTRQ
jgi:hypothetical protein